MELELSFEVILLLKSLILGVGIAVFYDFFRILRLAFNFKTVSIFVQDIVFLIVAALTVTVFIFAVNSGEARGYMFMSMAAGAAVYTVTLGAVIMGSSRVIIRFLKRAFNRAKEAVMRPVRKFLIIFRIKNRRFARKRRISRYYSKKLSQNPFSSPRKYCRMSKRSGSAEGGELRGEEEGKPSVEGGSS